MNFCTLFLKTENVHLKKDIGQLPYCLQKDYGYDVCIATYRNGDYPYLENEVKNLRLEFVKKTFFGQAIDGLFFLYRMRKSIDVLNVYHLNLNSFLWTGFFKLLRRKEAIIYLKLDANHMEISKMQRKGLIAWMKKVTLHNADIVSAETSEIQKALQKYCKVPIIYIPNGYLDLKKEENAPIKKENIVLTVGRLGTYPKATEVLVEAFFRADLRSEWKLVLIGAATDEFKLWLDDKLCENTEMRDKILLLGNIENQEILQEWYAKAKIFSLPSRWEGFCLALIEAMEHGCYVITSDAVLAAKDLLQNKTMGAVVGKDRQDELAYALKEASCMEIDWDENAKSIALSVKDKFLWTNILKVLDCTIKSEVEKKKCALLK